MRRSTMPFRVLMFRLSGHRAPEDTWGAILSDGRSTLVRRAAPTNSRVGRYLARSALVGTMRACGARGWETPGIVIGLDGGRDDVRVADASTRVGPTPRDAGGRVTDGGISRD